jgi:phenylalanyl-tRNA synthetase alpha chain
MRQRLEELLNEARAEIEKSGLKDALVGVKSKYLGRKGLLQGFFKELGALAVDERKRAGEFINTVKQSLETEIDSRLSSIHAEEQAERLKTERLDVTLPGRARPLGSIHPVTRTLWEVEDIFSALGFGIAEGPEVEIEYYNFEALNIPRDHPARDMQDTFYINQEVLLRTHTSPVQIRVMEEHPPPLRIIAPGTVYRRDSDVTHTPMFHQVEGFMVDTNVTFSNLKGILTHLLHSLFGDSIEVRFRPSFFPFTEPSAEVDIRCVICKGKSSTCRVCKGSGWLEVLGAGMIHPEVFKSVKYDPEKVSGFAFGLGIERIAMLKYGIDDLRLFFDNDIRFLSQY